MVHPDAIANILSFKHVKSKYKVQFDSGLGDAFVVTKPDGEVFVFMESDSGLYFLDTAKDRKETSQGEFILVSMVVDH